MSNDIQPDKIEPGGIEPGDKKPEDAGEPRRRSARSAAENGPSRLVLMELPGLAAISLYMLFLAGTVILGVGTRHYPPLYLAFPVLFFAAGLGLLMLFRWAWAMALGAVVLLVALFLYQFTTQGALSAVVQGLLNLVFFLYLVRPEVRSRLR